MGEAKEEEARELMMRKLASCIAISDEVFDLHLGIYIDDNEMLFGKIAKASAKRERGRK